MRAGDLTQSGCRESPLIGLSRTDPRSHMDGVLRFWAVSGFDVPLLYTVWLEDAYNAAGLAMPDNTSIADAHLCASSRFLTVLAGHGDVFLFQFSTSDGEAACKARRTRRAPPRASCRPRSCA